MSIVLLFLVIAFLRVIQKIAYKNSSMKIDSNIAFFRFGAIYQFMAGILSVFAFVGYGCQGLNMQTVVCALIMAVLFALDLYTGIEAVKEAPLILINIYSLGGLVLSCILGYFMFGEEVSAFQAVGLVMFFGGVYFLTPSGKKEKHKLSFKTILMLIMSFFINGIVMVTQKYFSLKVEGGNPAIFSFLTFIFNAFLLFVCWIFLLVKSKKNAVLKENEIQVVTEKKKIKIFGMEGILYIYAFLMAVALFGINLIITELGRKVSSVVLFPISSAIAIIITVLIGRLVYNERISKKGIVGLILGFSSIIIIGVFTPEVVNKLFS